MRCGDCAGTVKTTNSCSFAIQAKKTNKTKTYCIATASSSYLKHVAEMTMLSRVTCDRFYRRTESLLQVILSSQGTVLTFLARSQACSEVGGSVQQSCHLACLWFSWICVEVEPRSDSTAQGLYSDIVADYRKNIISFIHLLKGIVSYKDPSPRITLRGQTDTVQTAVIAEVFEWP